MKRYILYFLCLVMVIVVLTSCDETKENTGSGNQKATNSNATPEQKKEPEVVSEEKAQAYAETILKDMSLDEKIGQMMIVDLTSLDVRKRKKPITTVTKSIEEQLTKYPVSGIVLLPENMKDKEQTVELVQNLQKCSSYYPFYIAVTEEWGDQSVFAQNEKLEGTGYPMLSEISLTKTLDDIYNMGKTTGSELKELGINLNLAPVADVSNGIKNAQYAKHCFSDDGDEVANYIEQAVRGMRDGGICTTITHFPGIGSVAEDYKTVLADNDSGLTRLRDVDFIPFSAGIEAGTDAVMISHVSVSKVTQNDTPASMSELIVTGILRDELGFEGIILSDSLSSPVITEKYEPGKETLQAIQAGVDIVLQPANIEKAFAMIREAVSNRSLDEKVLNEAVMRILKNKIQRGIIEIDTAISG